MPSAVRPLPKIVSRHASPVATDGSRTPASARIAGKKLKHTVRMLTGTQQIRLWAGQDADRVKGQGVQQRVLFRHGGLHFHSWASGRPDKSRCGSRCRENLIDRPQCRWRWRHTGTLSGQQRGNRVTQGSHRLKIRRCGGSGPGLAARFGSQPRGQSRWFVEQVHIRPVSADTGVHQIERQRLTKERKTRRGGQRLRFIRILSCC
jgi:hypothetical protein